MIAAWMAYSTVLGVLVVLGAMPVERLVRSTGGPTRRVWTSALYAAVLMPLIGLLLKDSAAAVEVGDALVVASPAAGIVMEGVDLLARLDRLLFGGWAILSTLMASILAGGLVATGLRARRWEKRQVDGVSVLVSRDVGPAVVGLRRYRIVLPRWALDLTHRQRSMMLRHEQEHVRAGDPGLWLFITALVAAFPWNPAIWYLAARARLAIEVDCDRRVLGEADRDLRPYAELLLSVGARQSRLAHGVGFSVGRPFLEERIDRMTAPTPPPTRLQTALVVLGLVGVLAAAWSVPQPVRAANVSNELPLMCPEDGGTTDLGVEMLTFLQRST